MKRWILLMPLVLLLNAMAHAQVTGTASTATFNCTASTGPFPFRFPAHDAAALQVIEIAPGSLPGVMTIVTGWTATPVNNSFANGGSITLVTPCPSGYTLTIARVTEQTQLTQYTPNMPALYANFQNNIDQLTTNTQDASRALQVQVGQLSGGGSASVTQTPLGQFLNLTFPSAGLPGTNPTFNGILSGPKISLSGDGLVTTGNLFNTVTAFPSIYNAPHTLNLYSDFITGSQDNYILEGTQITENDLTDGWTPGTIFNQIVAMHMNSSGDTIARLVEVLCKGSSSVQNEGCKDSHIVTTEFPTIFQGTLNSIPLCAGGNCTFSMTQTQGYSSTVNGVTYLGPGAKMHLIDLTNAITAGYITGYSGFGYSNFTASGTAFSTPNGTSAITTSTTSIGSTTAATVNGTITLTSPSGFAVSGTNLICLFDPTTADYVWTCAHITNLTGSVATIDYIPEGYLFPAGSTVSQGGLAGWGFSLDWDSHCAAVSLGCPGGPNGYPLPPDNAYNGIVRMDYPVVGNTSATSIEVYGFEGSQTPSSGGTSTTGVYHLFPQVIVYDPYNYTTKKLDASAVQTSPINQGMTFSASDVIEQPNYFSLRATAQTIYAWKAQGSPNALPTGISLTLGGNYRDGSQAMPIYNFNNPCLYAGIPSGVQPLMPWPNNSAGASVGCSGSAGVYGTGQGQYGAPQGVRFGGAVSSGVTLGLPVLSVGYNGIGKAALFVGADLTTAMANQWATASPVLGHVNNLGGATPGEDFVNYYPAQDLWDVTAGSTDPYGTGATHYYFSPTALTVPNLVISGTCTGCGASPFNYLVNQSSTLQPIQISTVASGSDYLWVNSFGGSAGWTFQNNTAANTWTSSLFNMDASYDAIFSGCAPGQTSVPASGPCRVLFGILGNGTNYTNNRGYYLSVPVEPVGNPTVTLPLATANAYIFALPTGASANAIPTAGTAGFGGTSSCSDNGTIFACSEPVQAPSFVATGGTPTTVNCSTSGTAIFLQSLTGTNDKKVVVTFAACLGTASYTFPTAFTVQPSVFASNDVAATLVTSRSTTAITVTGTTSTGTLFLEGY
jgi:hypothetical protein